MNLMLDFLKTMFLMSPPAVIWVGLLMGINMAGPLFFINHIEAQVVLGFAMAGGGIMMGIFSAKGYVRLLGIGHILWIPMLGWLVTRETFTPDTAFGYWLLAVVVLNGISLIIDTTDVICYIKGERSPWITADSEPN